MIVLPRSRFGSPRQFSVRYIHGLVTDASGKPPVRRPWASVWVELYDVDDPDHAVSTADVDSSGRFSVAALEGRRYRIEASQLTSADIRDISTALKSERQEVPDDPSVPIRLVPSRPVRLPVEYR